MFMERLDVALLIFVSVSLIWRVLPISICIMQIWVTQ